MKATFKKMSLFVWLLAVCFTAQSQLGGVGFAARYYSTTVGKNAYLAPEKDTYKRLMPTFLIEGVSDEKFIRGETDFIMGLGSLRLQEPNNSPRTAYGHNILNMEYCLNLSGSGNMGFGIGYALLWRNEGLLFSEINNNSYEVYRGGWGDEHGNYFIGSGRFIRQQRVGIGPQFHLLKFTDNENAAFRLAYTLSTYGKKGSYTALELGAYFGLGDDRTLRISLKQYWKKFRNPEDLLVYSDGSTTGMPLTLPEKTRVTTTDLSVAILFASWLNSW